MEFFSPTTESMTIFKEFEIEGMNSSLKLDSGRYFSTSFLS